MALEHELTTFKRELPGLSSHEGQYALVADDRVLGLFDSYGDALQAGYKECGVSAPFMVKRISAVEAVANFTRAIGLECTVPTP